MKTIASVLALALGLSLGACSGANEAGAVALSTICAATADCTFAATCSNQYIGQIALDVSTATHLWLFVQVNNKLTNNADAAGGRTNTHDAHITSFEMEYDGGFDVASASWPTAITVPAAGSSTASVLVVPPRTIAAPAATVQIVARVKAKGFYEDGSTFESGEYPVPFTYCTGCLGAPSCPTAGDVVKSTCPPDSVGQLPLALTCGAP